MTLTLDLPEELAQSLLARPVEERNRFAATAFATALAHEQTERDILKHSLQQSITGKTRPAAVVHAELRARYSLPDLASLTQEQIQQKEDAALSVLTDVERAKLGL